MRTLVLALSAATLTVPALAVPTTPAVAQERYHGKTWRGSDGRTYCRKSNGTTGLLVGAPPVRLAGREIAGRGSRTTAPCRRRGRSPDRRHVRATSSRVAAPLASSLRPRRKRGSNQLRSRQRDASSLRSSQ